MDKLIEYTGIIHILDDEINMVNSLEKSLSAMGLKTSREIDPIDDWDVFLVDEHLSYGNTEKSGCELSRAIRAMNKKIITILMTGDTSFSTVQKAFKAGTDYYINKPFYIEELVKSIISIVNQKIEKDLLENYEQRVLKKHLYESVSELFKDRINNQLTSMIMTLHLQKDRIPEEILTFMKSSVFSISGEIDELLEELGADLLNSSSK